MLLLTVTLLGTTASAAFGDETAAQPPAQAAPQAAALNTRRDEALRLWNEGNATDALRLLSETLQTHADWADGYFLRAAFQAKSSAGVAPNATDVERAAAATATKGAIADLQTFLRLRPQAPSRTQIEATLQELQQRLASLEPATATATATATAPAPAQVLPKVSLAPLAPRLKELSSTGQHTQQAGLRDILTRYDAADVDRASCVFNLRTRAHAYYPRGGGPREWAADTTTTSQVFLRALERISYSSVRRAFFGKSVEARSHGQLTFHARRGAYAALSRASHTVTEADSAGKSHATTASSSAAGAIVPLLVEGQEALAAHLALLLEEARRRCQEPLATSETDPWKRLRTLVGAQQASVALSVPSPQGATACTWEFLVSLADPAAGTLEDVKILNCPGAPPRQERTLLQLAALLPPLPEPARAAQGDPQYTFPAAGATAVVLRSAPGQSAFLTAGEAAQQPPSAAQEQLRYFSTPEAARAFAELLGAAARTAALAHRTLPAASPPPSASASLPSAAAPPGTAAAPLAPSAGTAAGPLAASAGAAPKTSPPPPPVRTDPEYVAREAWRSARATRRKAIAIPLYTVGALLGGGAIVFMMRGSNVNDELTRGGFASAPALRARADDGASYNRYAWALGLTGIGAIVGATLGVLFNQDPGELSRPGPGVGLRMGLGAAGNTPTLVLRGEFP